MFSIIENVKVVSHAVTVKTKCFLYNNNSNDNCGSSGVAKGNKKFREYVHCIFRLSIEEIM